ncbi:hypothetical protein RQM65_01900 [Pricia sp. S334]|uniref:Cardiolipin synthetase n=1 Tax=Pricia mediterranea TaxID=3076079 RepID=A0ABU3L1C8_9FLAO|nr:hypothetical protein [Pricia sp. S334]MDT7827415.1 hypothetical protein [Pricia sp. S334]
MKKFIALTVLIVYGCSDISLVENYKNPDIVLFHAYKVLLVGMAQNDKGQSKFETLLQKEFEKRDVEAMRSLDVFDINFTDSEKSEKELDDVEQLLIDRDFDAVLITKVIGSEDRHSFRKSIAQWSNYSGRFRDDYRSHQDLYYDTDYYDPFTIYHAETSLYCICQDKERALIWRGSIEITDPTDIEKAIDDYVKLIIKAMEEQQLIFHEN